MIRWLGAALVAVVAVASAHAAGNPPVIGFMVPGDEATAQDIREAFLSGLQEVGYGPDRATVEIRYVGFTPGRATRVAEEFVALGVKVIVTGGTPATLAAQRVSTSIPIVFGAAGDPVASGIVRSLAHPGGNATGISLLTSELNAKRLALFKEAAPDASQIAVLGNPSNPVEPVMLRDFPETARSFGFGVQVFEAHRPEDLDKAIADAAAWGAAGMLVLDDALFSRNIKAIVVSGMKHKLPLICPYSGMGRDGCFIAYGVEIRDNFHRAAYFVDKILKGTKPGDLPVENPSRFGFALNVKTAKALGLFPPTSILLRADEVIE